MTEEGIQKWKEHFERVINHEEEELPNPPKVEPGNDLNIRTGSITCAEIRNAIKKLKS